jgi:GT2 family glycosyltransferase
MVETKVREPLVSVVIVNWNGLEDTKKCLKHLKNQTYHNFETIVVDNGSRDGSLNYLRRLDGIKLVENHKNLGFTGGHIAGYKVAKGKFILLLNNDAIINHDYLQLAVKAMQADKRIGAIGGRAYLWDEKNKLFDNTDNFYSYQIINPITAEGIFKQEDEGRPQIVNNVSGSCVLVRRSVCEKIGYLHRPFFAYYEESDLFARMKRAGYKIIYHPGLAIWHANAKTSNRKAPTFAYYMMMRNRFRFAVRNFEMRYLLRFFNFYLKMGLVSIAKSILPIYERSIHQAYAKAFLYNLIFGWVAFIERIKLNNQLGPTNYSQIIIKEQINCSFIVHCNSRSDLKKCLAISNQIPIGSEVIIVVSKPELINKLPGFRYKNSPVRLCIDRGYFKTHPENLGAICAKYDWLAITSINELINKPETLFDLVNNAIYSMVRYGKKVAYFNNEVDKVNSPAELLNAPAFNLVVLHKNIFIEAGGLNREVSKSEALRTLITYGALISSILKMRANLNENLEPFRNASDSHQLINRLWAKHKEALLQSRSPSLIDKITARYYRLAQLRNLLLWLISMNIPPRLKAGRIKNLILATLTLNRRGLATELRHIGNELIKNRQFADLVQMKENEKKRLKYLLNHPEETMIFIIIRDRFSHLVRLINWLEQQKLKRIVLVDNDSRFPPLVDYLNKTTYQVLKMGRNTGHTGLWSSGIIKILLPDDFYVVTDPDIIPTSPGKDTLKHLYKIHAKYPYHLKVGLGLKIDDIPDHYVLKKEVIRWESQFWKYPLEDGVFEAGVDTTFALYKPYTYQHFIHPSLRTGAPFIARHLPWYTQSRRLSNEEVFYRLRLDENVNTWDKEHLPERYKKELAKQRH